MDPSDLAKTIAENVGYMPIILKLGQLASGAQGVASQAGATLLDTITKARNLLPDLAEGDVKLARGDITPQEHPATRVMDQLNAKAKAEGRDTFTFLGHALKTDSKATVEDLLSTYPQGELESAGDVGTTLGTLLSGGAQTMAGRALRGIEGIKDVGRGGSTILGAQRTRRNVNIGAREYIELEKLRKAAMAADFLEGKTVTGASTVMAREGAARKRNQRGYQY